MRTMKPLPFLLLVLLALPAAVQAQFTFTTNNGAITITGFTGNPTTLNIPNTTNGLPVTSIGNLAFAGKFNVTSVTIGTNVTSIGANAFIGCSRLTGITIPESVTNFGYGPFANCTKLTAINVDINNPAYTSVGGVLFNQGQTTLVQCPGAMTGSYIVPNSVIIIGNYSFDNCTNLTNISIPSSVTSIGNDGVFGCRSLTSITIPSSVTSIGTNAFNQCAILTNVIIPYSVTNLGDGAFASCTSLKAISVDTNSPAYSSVGGVLFNQNQTLLIQYPAGIAGNYIIPNSVTTVGNDSFFLCSSLTGITIPNTVSSIGEWAFADCSGLTDVTIPNSVTNIEYEAFFNCPDLAGIYFLGNAPTANTFVSQVFTADNATVYYLPGTTGWSSTFCQLPTVLWNPQAQNDASFGMQTNQFGFNITGTGGLVIVVEASTNLSNPVWTPIATNTLTSGSVYFSDPQWTNYPGRYYRLRSP